MDIANKIENILWHIGVNRKLLGDKRMLDDVTASLKNLHNDLEKSKNNTIRSGYLLYKCRQCGKTVKNVHVPDGLTVLSSVMNDIPLPKEVLGFTVKKTGLCGCWDGGIGVTDLIGFEEDPDDK